MIIYFTFCILLSLVSMTLLMLVDRQEKGEFQIKVLDLLLFPLGIMIYCIPIFGQVLGVMAIVESLEKLYNYSDFQEKVRIFLNKRIL